MFAQFGTGQEYRGKIRSLFVNLKDKANPSLRESIVSGELSPEKFSKMTSEVLCRPLILTCPDSSEGLGNDDRGTACWRPENKGRELVQVTWRWGARSRDGRFPVWEMQAGESSFLHECVSRRLTPVQRKCRYRQAQTRSADEPMTTFVTYVYLVRPIDSLTECFVQMCQLWKQVSDPCLHSLSSLPTVSFRWKFS